MLCACSGEQFKFDEAPQSPESLATRDFSASGISSRVGEWDSKLDDLQVDEAESTLKEALSLNYEEARALLGRLEYQRGNFDAALQVFRGIDIRSLMPRMIRAIVERTRPRKPRAKGVIVSPSVMSMHSVSLLLEAILLKAKSLEELGQHSEAAKECNIILDIVESARPNGIPEGISEACKLQEMFHKALELLPHLWIQAGSLDEAITAYRRVLIKPWNLEPERLANVQKNLAATLLYGGVEANPPPQVPVMGSRSTPKDNIEEAILLMLILMKKVALGEIKWDAEIMNHMSYAFSVTGQFDLLADHVEQVLPGVYSRAERWYFLALCYSATGQIEVALNLLKKVSSYSEERHKTHFPSLLLGAKLGSLDAMHAIDGIHFARKVLALANDQNGHIMGQAHKFLGVCYGNAARISISDSERASFQKESLISLNKAALSKEDPEVIFNLGLENAVQRNLDVAFDFAVMYSSTKVGNTAKGWKLLALILSAEKRFVDAETIVEFAIDEAGRIDKLELLRLKAVLQIAQKQPKQAIETYRTLLALIQAQKELQAEHTFDSESLLERIFETEAWQDLATVYTELGSWPDAKICLSKAESTEFYSSKGWHRTGVLFEAQSLHEEALVAFFMSLTIEPDHVPSVVSTAEVLMQLGNHSLPIARSLLMNALRLEPTNHDAWMNLGLISKRQGLTQQAAEFFQAAYELKLSAPVHSFTQ